jgi:hypothetical protein
LQHDRGGGQYKHAHRHIPVAIEHREAIEEVEVLVG